MIEADIVIVTSKLDLASINIKEHLLRKLKFKETQLKVDGECVLHTEHEGKEVLLVTVSRDLIYADYVENFVSAKFMVFASRHSSKSGFPMFSAHVPGNWTTDVEYGGRPKSLCIAPAYLLSKIVKLEMELLRERELEGWRCGFEVTHHGPYIDRIPTVFVEIGSEESKWRDPEAGDFIAEVIVRALEEKLRSEVAGVGLGGPHYAPRFNEFVKKSEIPIGHIVPLYVFDFISQNEVEMAVRRTLEKVKWAVLDWKGLKRRHKDWLLPYLKELKLKVVRA